MNAPIWKCYRCGGPVALDENGEPFIWIELTQYKKDEMQAVGSACWECASRPGLGISPVDQTTA